MRVLTLLAVVVVFASCIPGPPVLEIRQGGLTVTSGQILNLGAELAEPDQPEKFAFQWYINDSPVSGAISADFTYTAPVVASISTVRLKVTATEQWRGTAESEISVSVLPSYVTHLNGSGSFTYSVDLGMNPLSVYFIFTNGGETDAARPLVAPNFAVSKQLPLSGSTDSGLSLGGDFSEARRGVPEVTEFNRNPPSFGESSAVFSRSVEFSAEPEFLFDTEGGTGIIKDRSLNIDATCRKVVDADGKRLNIWVADDDWGTVTLAMVDALAERFLKTGTGNDIYDWVTGIFGEEWGTHGFSNLIQMDNEITIMLYDIMGDGFPPSGEGRVVGLFDSINNFTQSAQSLSNERLMFFIDAPLFAEDEGGDGWSITDDFWPNEVVATLAHEFQHMIHFYQKAVKNNLPVSSDVWINEMCSMAAEDLVSDKIQADGPRGVLYSDGTAGSPGNTADRLARYNYYNDSSLTYWPAYTAPPEESLPHYSLSYSIGAYLARNYNGPGLFRLIIQNAETDYRALTSALAASGQGLSFTGLLQRWGAAVLLSDLTSAPEIYRYNSGSFFSFNLEGINYNAGSVNLYNYYYESAGEQQSGPKVYTSSPVGQALLSPASNTFFYAGGGLSGTKSWDISVPDQVKVTVVFR